MFQRIISERRGLETEFWDQKWAKKELWEDSVKIGNNISSLGVEPEPSNLYRVLKISLLTVSLWKTKSHFVVDSTLGQNSTTGKGNFEYMFWDT